jgi:recombination associated protein RdgC
VSFVLTEALTLKKIKLLDVVLEGVSSATKDEGGFDADVALFTGELRLLIPALVEALGGVQERVLPPAAPARPADATADTVAPWDTVPA